MIKNATSYDLEEIKRLVTFVVRQTKVRLPRSFEVKNKRQGAMSGTCRWPGDAIVLRLNPQALYPHVFHNHGLKACAPVTLGSWQEAFVYILAHELEHKHAMRAGEWQGRRRMYLEVDADRAGQTALQKFREGGGSDSL